MKQKKRKAKKKHTYTLFVNIGKMGLKKNKTKQIPTTLPSNWTLAFSSRAFQVRKIDRINTYLAVYGLHDDWRSSAINTT